MIIRKKENWFRMLFVWKGSVLPQILSQLAVLVLISIVVVYCRGDIFNYKVELNPTPFTLFGIALAIFLSFRNTVSYDRFWEGRKLWGAILNTTRSLTRQSLTLNNLKSDGAETRQFVDYLIAFTYSLKHQLRQTDAEVDLKRLLKPELTEYFIKVAYKPALLIRELGLWVKEERLKGNIDLLLAANFDHNLNELSNILGGCERIASTPIPYTYKVLLHRTVYVYCFLLPLGFVDTLGWMTPLIVAFIGYTFIALDAVADELEDPFGLEPNDLALNALCRMIEDTLLEMIDVETPDRHITHSYMLD